MPVGIDRFENLFNPDSIAVVGASNVIGKWGFILPLNLVLGGWKKKLYLVNPKEKYVQGYRAIPSVSELPEPVDLMIVTVPASAVPGVMEEAREKGIKSAVVISAGFSETGEEGRKLEERVVKIASEAGILMVGPNTMGICSPPTRLYALGAAVVPPEGRIAFLSQSGNLGVQVLGWAERGGLGISRFINSGNEGQLTCDFALEYFGKDPHTKVILLYLEGIDYGERFYEIASWVSKQKPIIVLKVGQTEAGQKAASSHSGAVATSYRVFQAMARQAGIIEARTTEELIDLARCFGVLPLPKGKRVGIMTLGGGWGVVTTDLCAREGLELPELSPQTLERIDRVLPKFWSRGNPVDMVGTVHRRAHFEIVQALAEEQNFDIIISLGSLIGVKIGRTTVFSRLIRAGDRILSHYKWRTPRFYFSLISGISRASRERERLARVGKSEKSGGIDFREAKAWTDEAFAEHLRKLMKEKGKPIIPVAFDSAMIPEIYRKFKLASFGIPEKAVMAVKKMAEYQFYLNRRKEQEEQEIYELVTEDIMKASEFYLQDFSGAMSESESKQLLRYYGICTTQEKLVQEEEEAIEAGKEIGYPLVVKVDSRDILHKTEAGVVKLGVKNEQELRQAYREVLENARRYKPEAVINGVLVQEMVPEGVEMIIGMNQDPIFGPVVIVGMGGIFVEALEDVAMRLTPVHRIDAQQMLEELKGKKLLKGFRGKPPADVDALVEMIIKVGRIAYDHKERIMEMDLNPVIVLPQGQGAKAVDALVILNQK